MMGARHAVVIGGGLVGGFTAYFLAQQGVRVTLVERDQLGSGSSAGNCGYICPSHALPLAVPGVIPATLSQLFRRDPAISFGRSQLPQLLPWLTRFALRCRRRPMLQAARARWSLLSSSWDLYRELLQGAAADCEWQERGLLVVYRERAKFERFERTAELLRREFGLSLRRIDADQLREVEPALQTGLAGGWMFPDDAHLRPEKLLDWLRKQLLEHDVTIAEQTHVQELHVQRGQLESIETDRGHLSADVAVLAAGAEVVRFAKSLQSPLPVQPGKGYSITLPAGDRTPKIPLIFEQHHVAVTPFKDELRIGSTLEFSGFDRTVPSHRIAQLMRSAAAHLVEIPPAVGRIGWAGWRPMTYDGIPIIDTPPGARNVVIAAGNGMIGVATAPATGKLAAALASGSVPFCDPSPFSLSRF